jgi:uncharacterized RDD family membrane protein YckC
MAAPAGWYPDPDGSGGQRYFDGTDWTEHRAPPTGAWPQSPWAPPGAPPGAWVPARPPWKGAELGRPAQGPGSLANPGRRLGARALDGLLLIPVYAVLAAVAVAIVAPHAGPIFPADNNGNPNVRQPTPGIVWIYLAVLVASLVAGLLAVVYEAVATARYGRTLGKKWLHIRPLRTDGSPLGWGRTLGRVAIYWLSTLFGTPGLINPLWCLWDGKQQCLHDKVADTIVVND